MDAYMSLTKNIFCVCEGGGQKNLNFLTDLCKSQGTQNQLWNFNFLTKIIKILQFFLVIEKKIAKNFNENFRGEEGSL